MLLSVPLTRRRKRHGGRGLEANEPPLLPDNEDGYVLSGGSCYLSATGVEKDIADFGIYRTAAVGSTSGGGSAGSLCPYHQLTEYRVRGRSAEDLNPVMRAYDAPYGIVIGATSGRHSGVQTGVASASKTFYRHRCQEQQQHVHLHRRASLVHVHGEGVAVPNNAGVAAEEMQTSFITFTPDRSRHRSAAAAVAADSSGLAGGLPPPSATRSDHDTAPIGGGDFDLIKDSTAAAESSPPAAVPTGGDDHAAVPQYPATKTQLPEQAGASEIDRAAATGEATLTVACTCTVRHRPNYAGWLPPPPSSAASHDAGGKLPGGGRVSADSSDN